jgi:hypothetical protein
MMMVTVTPNAQWLEGQAPARLVPLRSSPREPYDRPGRHWTAAMRSGGARRLVVTLGPTD